MADFRTFLENQLRDPEVKNEYDNLQPSFAIISAIIGARKSAGLTQKDLAERSGIAQSDISMLERGKSNPSINKLQRLARAMGKTLKIVFEDEQPVACSAQSNSEVIYSTVGYSKTYVTTSFVNRQEIVKATPMTCRFISQGVKM